jgi:hypothetical protein
MLLRVFYPAIRGRVLRNRHELCLLGDEFYLPVTISFAAELETKGSSLWSTSSLIQTDYVFGHRVKRYSGVPNLNYGDKIVAFTNVPYINPSIVVIGINCSCIFDTIASWTSVK